MSRGTFTLPTDSAGIAKLSWLEDFFEYIYATNLKKASTVSANIPDTVVFKYQRPSEKAPDYLIPQGWVVFLQHG
jgi:hypothetical protein